MSVDAAFSSPPRGRNTSVEAAELVIGPDDRVLVGDLDTAPMPWICALQIRGPSGRSYTGTGWLAGPSLVVTAGHCVFLGQHEGWASSVRVTFGSDGGPPRHASTSDRLLVAQGFVRDGGAAHDLGAIVLPEPIGKTLGYFSFGALDDDALERATVSVTGYPSDLSSGARLYTHARRVVRTSPAFIGYDVDTFAGQSGSPVWTQLSGRPVAVGVHTTGDVAVNQGLRLTPAALRPLREWKSITP